MLVEDMKMFMPFITNAKNNIFYRNIQAERELKLSLQHNFCFERVGLYFELEVKALVVYALQNVSTRPSLTR
jgi:hypothetical protein